ncbi:glutaminase A [Maricaulis parjimensis]|uniref:glutaminase A n=1 Tax=Maricaulis parjimensis TaxID=144023 RepID=UPI001939CD4C|nr:glutaminase A [Maricaulis parjimensis]
MFRSGLSRFSRYRGRRARFEHGPQDEAALDIRLAALCRQAAGLGLTSPQILLEYLDARGLDTGLPRLSACLAALSRARGPLAPEQFGQDLSHDGLDLLERAVGDDLAIPNFAHFCHRVSGFFSYAQENRRGQIADYIPELARQDADGFGLALCSIDGQRFNLGDAQTGFCLQSVVKPLNYALALALNGESLVHAHVGREPSGRRFNELALDPDHRPHNPMINAGAIMCAALIRPAQPVEARAELIRRFVMSAAGGADCRLDEAVYRSELATADRNRSLVKMMDEHDAFPPGTDTQAALDLYFRACALSLDCDALSVVAAMLANGGVCPVTGHRVIDPVMVRHTLSLMLTCGMYDYSGEFAFTVGLPAKSGVSGGLMIVIPGVGGFGLWSPRLDRQGNSVRGVEFCQRLVEDYPFHIFAGVASD